MVAADARSDSGSRRRTGDAVLRLHRVCCTAEMEAARQTRCEADTNLRSELSRTGSNTSETNYGG